MGFEIIILPPIDIIASNFASLDTSPVVTGYVAKVAARLKQNPPRLRAQV